MSRFMVSCNFSIIICYRILRVLNRLLFKKNILNIIIEEDIDSQNDIRKYLDLVEERNTFTRLKREYEMLDHTRKQLAARTALKESFPDIKDN